ncbi:Hypothetical protein R9X50_00437700 [Acrodontium crateriforme]|uniref:Uncharacterized protein n=1 Tax=Acrodontium crateriforme TaxID=150365 RepID=A0AAQ3RA56_9PEZI|nr:Hypothetical protein R9X50_00437700 [Acrodontium crateriforme]
MKNLVVLASAIPAARALVGNDWEFSGAPSSGLADVTFPLNIANAPHKEGYYFAQQFGFHNGGDVGYTGLQPRPDSSDGSSNIHAAFSSFIEGTTSSDSNCSDGADGGSGVSCATDFQDTYADTYNLVVENVGGTTWKGTVVNTVSGNQYHIGQYTLPSNYGNINSTEVGFVEYYPWNGQASHQCSETPITEVTFGNPTSNSGGTGKVDKPYEYGDCIGKVQFETTQTSNGWNIKLGYPNGDGS